MKSNRDAGADAQGKRQYDDSASCDQGSLKPLTRVEHRQSIDEATDLESAAGNVDVTARLWRVSTDLVGLTGSHAD